MSAEKITMYLNVPENVLEQSHVAKVASDLSLGKMPLGEMLRAKAIVDGLLPLTEDLYAPKPIKAGENFMDATLKVDLQFSNVTCGDAQTFIRDRNRAEKAVIAIRTNATFLRAALEQIAAEKAAKKAVKAA